jgi:cystathionine beta-synthase
VSDRLAKEIRGAYKPDQYHNPANPEIHYKTTGPEIWEQTEGKITHLIVGMGTGGTITGCAKYLKENNPKIKVIGVDPVGSVFFEYKRSGKFPKLMKTYKVEGVGEDFIPSTIDFQYIDEVIQVEDKECFLTARRFVREEGLLIGGSSGMAMWAALQITTKLKSGMVVVILPDSGKSYLSKMYNDDWMRQNGFLSLDNKERIVSNLLKIRKTPKLLQVKPRDTVSTAIRLMKKYDISQVPVIDQQKLLGKVTERVLLSGLYDKSIGPSNHISALIDPYVTTVLENESIDHVSEVLTKENFVVVLDINNKPLGVISRIDLIEYYT